MKTCKHCQEEVKDGAKRCPHCQGDLRSFINRHPFITVMLFIIGLSIVVNVIADPSKKVKEANRDSSSTQSATPIPQAQRQELANTYCKTHQPGFKLHNETLTQEQCDTWINGLADKGIDYGDIKKISEGAIWMGMTSNEATLAIGPANDINSTTTSGGEHQQWVYGSGVGAKYLYFDGPDKDNLTLTSWQNL